MTPIKEEQKNHYEEILKDVYNDENNIFETNDFLTAEEEKDQRVS